MDMARSRATQSPIGARTELRYAISNPGSMIIDRSSEIDGYHDAEQDVSGGETLEVAATTSDKHQRISVSIIDTDDADCFETPLNQEDNVSDEVKMEGPAIRQVQIVGRAPRRMRVSRVSKIAPVIPKASPTMRLLLRTRQGDITKALDAQDIAQAAQREQIMKEWKSGEIADDRDYLEVLEARKLVRVPAHGSLDRSKTPYQRIFDTRTINSRKHNWKVHDRKRRDVDIEGEEKSQECSTDPPTLMSGATQLG